VGTILTLLVGLTATRVRIGFVDVLAAAQHRQSQVAAAADGGDMEKLSACPGNGGRSHSHVRSQYDPTYQDANAAAQNLAQDPRTVSAAWWTFGGFLCCRCWRPSPEH